MHKNSPSPAAARGFLSNKLFAFVLHAIFLVVSLGLPVDVQAQTPKTETGSISGRVLNQATGKYLADAVVKVEGTSIEAISDKNGNFRLFNVPVGAVSISATYVDLDKSTKSVTVGTGATIAVAISFATRAVVAAPATLPADFCFGIQDSDEGKIAITAKSTYSHDVGYGFINTDNIRAVSAGGGNEFKGAALTSNKPFVFNVDLPEGNYDVTLLLGDPVEDSDTTVKVESRRLMLESVKASKGEIATRTFTVNIHTPKIGGTDRLVSLKPREIGALHWDETLTIEFNGPHAAVTGMSIRRNDDALTVYLAGDSTVTDQRNEPLGFMGAGASEVFRPRHSNRQLCRSGTFARHLQRRPTSRKKSSARSNPATTFSYNLVIMT